MTRTLALSAFLSALLVGPVYAADPATRTIADIYKDKAALKGQEVTLHGKVVKSNNAIMDRNWLHVRDGSGSAADGSNDIAVTTQDTAAVDDQVTITGTLGVDVDFGAGYLYPVIVEKATVTKNK
jgi:hypothetical protein